MKRCPNCPDQGWYASSNPNTGEPEQVQCEFCECEPDSVFNTIRGLQKELDELKASIPHLISNAIYEALVKFGPTNGYHAIDLVDHLEEFAGQLTSKE